MYMEPEFDNFEQSKRLQKKNQNKTWKGTGD